MYVDQLTCVKLLEVVVRDDDVGGLGQDIRSQLLPVLSSLVESTSTQTGAARRKEQKTQKSPRLTAVVWYVVVQHPKCVAIARQSCLLGTKRDQRDATFDTWTRPSFQKTISA